MVIEVITGIPGITDVVLVAWERWGTARVSASDLRKDDS